MRLQSHLRSKLVHSKLLYDLEKVNLFVQLSLGILEQEVISLFPRFTAAANSSVKLVHAPKPAELVREGLSRLYFKPNFFGALLFSILLTCEFLRHL